jgi:competence protein ComEC
MQDYLSRYPLVFIFCCFAAGIWLQDRLNISPLILVILFFLNFLLLVILSRSIFLPAFLGLIFFQMGQLSICFWQQHNLEHSLTPHFPLEGVTVRGELLEPPEKDRRTGIIRIVHMEVIDRIIKIQKKFIFKFPDDFPDLLPGDQLIFQNISLTHLEKRRNPGQFDYSRYLRMQGVIGQIISSDTSYIEGIPSTDLISLRRSIFLIRQTIDRQFYRFMNERVAGFLSAILLGKKEGIQPDIMLDFQRGGVAHVIAISGLNVGFIVFILLITLSFFPVSFRWQNAAAIILLIIHMLLTGANPPVVRATIMVIIYLLGIILQRKPDVYNTLFFAGFLFLLYHPQDLYSLSFQFSFLAVLTMLLFYEKFRPVEKKISDRLPRGKIFKKIIIATIQLFLISLAAQIGTIPLTAIHFKQLPVISLFLNLIVIPVLGFITPIGYIILFSAPLSASLAQIVSDFLALIMDMLFKVVHLTANFPGAYVRVWSFDKITFFIYLTVILIGWSFTSTRVTHFRKVLIANGIILLLWKFAPVPNQVQLLMMDVGQGESTLLISPTSQKILFDTGPTSEYWDSGTKVIYPVLLELGISNLDKVILSHPHSDHVGGIFSLMNQVTIDSIFLPAVKVSYFWQDSLLHSFARKGISYRCIQMGDQIKIDPVSRIYILAPAEEQLCPPDVSGKSLNNTSLVCLVKISGTTILFTGDTESDREVDLLRWNSFLKADVLKVGHHGSNSSSSLQFLQKIDPQLALIPVGKDNKFDHPSPEVLGRLNALKIPYYRTDLQGAIWLEWTPPEWEFNDWE